jgi:hypothetical protein
VVGGRDLPSSSSIHKAVVRRCSMRKLEALLFQAVLLDRSGAVVATARPSGSITGSCVLPAG